MFSLNETTRKRVCRTAFFLLCVAPTLATLAWSGYSCRPGRQRQWQDALGDRLDVQAFISGSQLPRPGETRCQTVALADVESGAPLVDLHGVQIRRAAATVVSAEIANIDSASLPRLTEQVGEWLARESSPIELRVAQAALVAPSSDSRDSSPRTMLGLRQLLGRMEIAETEDRGQVKRLSLGAAVVDDQGDSGSITASVQRWNADGRPELTAQCDLRETRVPIVLLSAVFPGVDKLAGGMLSGQLRWDIDSDGLRGAFAGRVEHIDLSQLLPASSPHRLEGLASINISQLRWREGRIERLEGELRATSGSTSRSLLIAAAEKLYCIVDDAGVSTRSDAAGVGVEVAPTMDVSPGRSDVVAFDQLAARFVLDDRGLTVWGICEPNGRLPAGCVATVDGRALLIQPRYVELPMGAWVQFLLAPAPSWLPATREAVETARRLPLSEAPVHAQ